MSPRRSFEQQSLQDDLTDFQGLGKEHSGVGQLSANVRRFPLVDLTSMWAQGFLILDVATNSNRCSQTRWTGIVCGNTDVP